MPSALVRPGSRWGWCSNTRSTSSLRRPSTRTSPSARKTWGWTRGRWTAGCGRPPASWDCGTTSWKSPPLSSPAARSGGWPSRGSSPWSPGCSFWTSPPPGWTLWEWSPSWATSGTITSPTMPPSSWSPTPWRRWPARWTGWWWSTTAASPSQGPPREVFRHGAELERMGLGVPQMTRVFSRLRAMGVDIDASVYTIPQAKETILRRLREKGVE